MPIDAEVLSLLVCWSLLEHFPFVSLSAPLPRFPVLSPLYSVLVALGLYRGDNTGVDTIIVKYYKYGSNQASVLPSVWNMSPTRSLGAGLMLVGRCQVCLFPKIRVLNSFEVLVI